MSNNALKDMGINNPEQIARYALYMVDNSDVLRIIYERKKGSLLPVSRKYRFPRIQKPAIVDSGTRRTEIMYESSPQFRNALTELEQLMKSRKDTGNTKKLLMDELRTLEEETSLRISTIRGLIEDMK